jgi:hypothetical protein
MRLIAQTVMESTATTNASAPYYTDDNPSPEGQPSNASKIALARKVLEAPTLDIFSPVEFDAFFKTDTGGMAQVGVYIADLRVQFLNKLLEAGDSLGVPQVQQHQWRAQRIYNLTWAIRFRARMEIDFMSNGDKNDHATK